MLRAKRKTVGSATAVAVTLAGLCYAGISVGRSEAPPDVPRAPATLGPLRAAPEAQAERDRALRALVRAVRCWEDTSAEGDMYLLVTRRGSTAYGDPAGETPPQVPAGQAPTPLGQPGRAAGASGGVTTDRVRWAFHGYKSRREWQRVIGSGQRDGPSDRGVASYDGSFSYMYRPAEGEGSVTIGRDTVAAADDIRYWTLTAIGGKRLSDLLSGDGVRYEGRQAVGETDCLKVSFPYSSGRFEVWLTPSHGYRAKRAAYTDRPNPSGRHGYIVTEVRKFAQYGASSWPSEGSLTRFAQDGRGHNDWLYTLDWSVVSLETKVEDCLFQLQFPLGTRVSDMTGEHPQTYTVGGAVPHLSPPTGGGK